MDEYVPRLQLGHRDVSKKELKLFALITTRKWSKLRFSLKKALLLRRPVVDKCSGTCSTACSSTHSALHYACQFRPPVNVVKLLYKSYPKAVFEKDCKDRYVVHVACKHGCDPDVIEFLIGKNPEAVTTKDVKDRTPFLLAFKSYVCRSNNRIGDANKDLLRVAKALFKADPTASIDEDYEGVSALEYAIDGELSMENVRYVQFLTNKKESQKSLSGTNHSKRLSLDGSIHSNRPSLAGTNHSNRSMPNLSINDSPGRIDQNRLKMEGLVQKRQYVMPKSHTVSPESSNLDKPRAMAA